MSNLCSISKPHTGAPCLPISQAVLTIISRLLWATPERNHSDLSEPTDCTGNSGGVSSFSADCCGIPKQNSSNLRPFYHPLGLFAVACKETSIRNPSSSGKHHRNLIFKVCELLSRERCPQSTRQYADRAVCTFQVLVWRLSLSDPPAGGGLFRNHSLFYNRYQLIPLL